MQSKRLYQRTLLFDAGLNSALRSFPSVHKFPLIEWERAGTEQIILAARLNLVRELCFPASLLELILRSSLPISTFFEKV
jgi:hypothetical protein